LDDDDDDDERTSIGFAKVLKYESFNHRQSRIL